MLLQVSLYYDGEGLLPKILRQNFLQVRVGREALFIFQFLQTTSEDSCSLRMLGILPVEQLIYAPYTRPSLPLWVEGSGMRG